MEEGYPPPSESPQNSIRNTNEANMTNKKEETPRIQESSLKDSKRDSAHNIKIAQIQGPVLILFAPPGGGKTLMLLRLIKYLTQLGYEVKPNRYFRTDKLYEDTINQFEHIQHQALEDVVYNRTTDCVLLDVEHGNDRFQILEAPGEHFFSTTQPAAEMPAYMQRVFFNHKIKKVFVFLFNQDLDNQAPRYAAAVNRVIQVNVTDVSQQVLLVYNKVDGFGNTDINAQRKRAIENFRMAYSPTINFMKGRGQDFQKHFTIFSAGNDISNGGLTESQDDYPRGLLEKVRQRFEKMQLAPAPSLTQQKMPNSPNTETQNRAKEEDTSIVFSLVGILVIIILSFVLFKMT